MYRCPPCINLAIPGEYRTAAENLFPLGGFAGGPEPDLKAAGDFAEALGIGAEYRRFLALRKDDREIQTFLEHFQNNLDLLIQKTWVEKADEARKERLQDDVPGLMTLIAEEDYRQALEAFGVILEELAYLFFGAQSAKDDFTEYTFRIDTQIGLFWWYGGHLSSLKGLKAPETGTLRAILFIGICYLMNF